MTYLAFIIRKINIDRQIRYIWVLTMQKLQFQIDKFLKKVRCHMPIKWISLMVNMMRNYVTSTTLLKLSFLTFYSIYHFSWIPSAALEQSFATPSVVTGSGRQPDPGFSLRRKHLPVKDCWWARRPVVGYLALCFVAPACLDPLNLHHRPKILGHQW